MRRPIGITAITIYFLSFGTLALLRDLIYRRPSPIVFWFDIVFDIGLLVIAFGLFRLWEWARFAGMLVIFVSVGLSMPFFFARVTYFDRTLFCMVAAYIVNLFLVWYLFRAATAKHFSRMLKTA